MLLGWVMLGFVVAVVVNDDVVFVAVPAGSSRLACFQQWVSLCVLLVFRFYS